MGSIRSFSTCVLLLRAGGSAAVPSSCRVDALHFSHPRVGRCRLSEQVIEPWEGPVLRRKAGLPQSFVQITSRFVGPHEALRDDVVDLAVQARDAPARL